MSRSRAPKVIKSASVRVSAGGNTSIDIRKRVEVMPVLVKQSEMFDLPDAEDAYVRVQLGSDTEHTLEYHARQFCKRVSAGRWSGFLMAPVWLAWLVDEMRDSQRRGGTVWLPAEDRFANGEQNVFGEASHSVDWDEVMANVRSDPGFGKALHTANAAGGMRAVLALCPLRELKVRKKS